ncbi:MAG TPA: preprotein translocase subunit SecG [Nitrospirae bacterium]|nr:protein-export membrane protein SecG [bacterium BMS3Abin06]HDH13616.1 preprotein translocase subunit SecG [Nitrospirota bacterium]HDZ00928.1 preprotein translocase subunit SecG [Nitrospirota bacterium]
MFTAVLTLHLIVCLFLIFIILIQSSKGAEMGAAFGGSSQTLFGSRGAATFLSKLTTAAAILFMITSLSLAIISVRRGSVMSSVPVKESPANPLADTTSGPLQEKPAAPGQGEVQNPAAPAAGQKQ